MSEPHQQGKLPNYRRRPGPRGPAQRRRERLEMLVGFLGCFTGIAFIFALVAEIQGRSATKEAIVLAVFAIFLGFAYRALQRAR